MPIEGILTFRRLTDKFDCILTYLRKEEEEYA